MKAYRLVNDGRGGWYVAAITSSGPRNIGKVYRSGGAYYAGVAPVKLYQRRVDAVRHLLEVSR